MMSMASSASAQDGPGDLHGRVVNDKGTPISRATVRIHDCLANWETPPTRKYDPPHSIVESDADGRYRNDKVGTFGPCVVTITANGYMPFERTLVKFPEDENTEINAELVASRSGASDLKLVPGSEGDFHSGPPDTGAAMAKWEYGALLQGGVGLEERTNFSFIMVGGHFGRILTDNFGPGLLKGNFEYAVEVFPFWQSYTPKFAQLKCPAGVILESQCYGPVTAGGTYTGVSITPIILRWNFTHGRRLMPWVQGAGGVLYTTRKYPGVGDLNFTDPTQTGPAADTSVWNFTPQGGVGAHYFVSPRRSVDMSVNAVHISSASLGDKNPGVNVSLQMSVGYTWWK